MSETVQEMNHRTQKRTFTQHRKIAVSFREESLLQVFEVSLQILSQIANRSLSINGQNASNEPQREQQILDQALQLCRNSISYDFIGTNPDESAEEVCSFPKLY